ncbi:hypothetical protein [Methanogenium organophilum]|uniref:Late embryogenesis abundant protein LEA-2 subgroup domain-containing protein n=1 Tax=Methanogenium organophilum TaxID=2199 RepID=A0A9X9T8R9_METOG|nr:hypothetical protein [Methanogenium organophilum]WAI02469.1 hypothetical protein OU421_06235 [Methanogenium organophilum]
MDLSRLCSVMVRGVSIETVSPAYIGGRVTVAVTSRAPARLTLSEIRFDILTADDTPERVIIHGWAENVSLGAYSTTEVPVSITVTSPEAVRFLTGALTRDIDARVHGTAKIDAYLSKITIPFDDVVTVPSLLSR